MAQQMTKNFKKLVSLLAALGGTLFFLGGVYAAEDPWLYEFVGLLMFVIAIWFFWRAIKETPPPSAEKPAQPPSPT